MLKTKTKTTTMMMAVVMTLTRLVLLSITLKVVGQRNLGRGRPGKGPAPQDISPPWTVC